MTRFAIILGVLVGATAVAFAEDADWKMYGSVKLSGEKAVCFFDAKSVNHRANGYIRVWTKWLPAQDLKNVDPELAEKIADKANKKLRKGYLPPYAVIKGDDWGDQIAWMEEAANLANIEPPLRALLSLNCQDETSRSFYTNTLGIVNDEPGELQHIAQGSNDANLLEILCKWWGRRPNYTNKAAKLLTKDEARRIAANIAKLPEFLRQD